MAEGKGKDGLTVLINDGTGKFTLLKGSPFQAGLNPNRIALGDVNADGLIGMTQSGYTAFMLSSYRPKSPLYIFSKERSLINQLSLSWGVRAFYYAEEDSLDDIFFDQIVILKERGFLKTGEIVVSTGSTPVHLHLPTNVLKITKVE